MMMTHARAPRCTFLLLSIVLIGAMVHSALGADPFRLDNKPPTSGVLTRSTDPFPIEFADSEMLSDLSGYIATLDGRDFVALRRGLGKFHPDPGSGTPIAFVRMQRDGFEDAMVRFSAHTDGTYSVLKIGSDFPPNLIDAKVLERRVPPVAPQPQLSLGDDESSRRFVLDQPYTPSPITLDSATRRSRFRANYPDLTRDLKNETMQVRLPMGFNPDTPAGILVWISPGPDGRMPPIFAPVCDQLGLICIGVDNNGNDRSLSDRLQIHMDSVETLAARYSIDRKQVYLTGMSGGGRSTSILQICFPEIFAGAVPIVGLNSYHNAPTGKGKEYWPAKLGKPGARWFKILKERRIAGITGTADFNEPEMSIRTKLLRKDKLQIRLDVIEGMAHTMPTPDQFSDAMHWVNELRVATRKKELDDAGSLLADLLEEHPQPDPEDPQQRRKLIEITILAPWSEPAWDAAELLGFQRARD